MSRKKKIKRLLRNILSGKDKKAEENLKNVLKEKAKERILKELQED